MYSYKYFVVYIHCKVKCADLKICGFLFLTIIVAIGLYTLYSTLKDISLPNQFEAQREGVQCLYEHYFDMLRNIYTFFYA